MKLVSSEGKEFDVPMEQMIASHQHPTLSKTLQNMFKDCVVDKIETINLTINSDILEVVIKYCQLLYMNPAKYIDCCDDTVYDNIRDHCRYHCENHLCYLNEDSVDENVFQECDYVTQQNRRTWKSEIDNYKNKCQLEFKIYNQPIWDALWQHLSHVHTTPYCCNEDYTLLEKNSMSPLHNINKWSKQFLSQYMNDVKSGIPLKDCVLTQLYFAAEYLELPDLTHDITIMISDYLEKLLKNDTEINIPVIRAILSQPSDLTQSQINDFNIINEFLIE